MNELDKKRLKNLYISKKISGPQVLRKTFSVAYQNRTEKFYMFRQGYRREGGLVVDGVMGWTQLGAVAAKYFLLLCVSGRGNDT